VGIQRLDCDRLRKAQRQEAVQRNLARPVERNGRDERRTELGERKRRQVRSTEFKGRKDRELLADGIIEFTVRERVSVRIAAAPEQDGAIGQSYVSPLVVAAPFPLRGEPHQRLCQADRIA